MINYYMLRSICVSIYWLLGFSLLFISPGLCIAKYEGLVAAWPLDEGAGEVARDISGNKHDGEIKGAKWVAGQFGKALEFDGKSAVVIPHSDALTLEFFTVTGWVKCQNQGAWQTIMTKTGADENVEPRNYGTFVVPNDGGIHFSLQGGNTKINSKEKVNDGKWHFVVMTRDKDGKLRGYIDGAKVVEGDSQKPGVNKTAVSIGAGGGGIRYWLIGSVDEVAIFNKALSEEDINGLMKKGLVMFTSVDKMDKLSTKWGMIKLYKE